MAAVTFEGVEKRYGQVSVIEDLNLDVQDHEFLVLVGPSGCGKTTALRMIAGLEDVSGGTIAIGGHVVNDVPPKARDIAMVFQNYALYPHMTVRENLEFSLKMRKTPPAQIEGLVSEAADLLGLGPLLDRKPAQLSGGQRQRVALGRALVREPPILVLDDPLSAVDAKTEAAILAAIERQAARRTVILITHRIAAARRCDAAVVLEAGRIIERGTHDELVKAGGVYAKFAEEQRIEEDLLALDDVALDSRRVEAPATP
jgi:multiple sugar transport system ATP-binding protein